MKQLFKTGPNPGTPDMERRLRQVLADCHDVPGAVVPILQEAQKIYGYLDPSVLEIVAGGLGMSVSQVASVASFYTFFNREQYGEHIIRVCRSAPCHVGGAQETVQALEQALGISVGGTTPDRAFSLLTCECLGVCDRAPAVMIDETVYGPVRPADVPGLLAGFGWEGT